MKHEWRKHEKNYYVPKAVPQKIKIPAFQFYSIEGTGNPNDALFAEKIAALYALSYGIRMLPKQGITPPGYMEYTVYPLEGIWSSSENPHETGYLDKDKLTYKIMIRQPAFVTTELAEENLLKMTNKKPNPHYGDVVFETLEDGLCVQMLHKGSYDDEPATFAQLDDFAAKEQLIRTSYSHREIYLSDPRKATPEKMKTILRYFVTEDNG